MRLVEVYIGVLDCVRPCVCMCRDGKSLIKIAGMGSVREVRKRILQLKSSVRYVCLVSGI